jgi:hypothetical protein
LRSVNYLNQTRQSSVGAKIFAEEKNRLKNNHFPDVPVAAPELEAAGVLGADSVLGELAGFSVPASAAFAGTSPAGASAAFSPEAAAGSVSPPLLAEPPPL